MWHYAHWTVAVLISDGNCNSRSTIDRIHHLQTLAQLPITSYCMHAFVYSKQMPYPEIQLRLECYRSTLGDTKSLLEEQLSEKTWIDLFELIFGKGFCALRQKPITIYSHPSLNEWCFQILDWDRIVSLIRAKLDWEYAKALKCCLRLTSLSSSYLGSWCS